MCWRFGGIFDYTSKSERLEEVLRELQNPKIWEKPDLAQALSKEKAGLESVVQGLDDLTQGLDTAEALRLMAEEEQDIETLEVIQNDLKPLEQAIYNLEFKRMFSDPSDENAAYLDIQSGSGGTEAQDWAEMLLRMYTRWGEGRDFKVELVDVSEGEVAGIKGATLRFEGAYAYGWLKTETGVHRLVRKSPFDSNNKRHTSFASVFVYPEIDDAIEVDMNPADLRIDTYRASGAGGQHVNRTDSAVRITHIPTGLVVQSQSDRSQHKNKAQCMKQLRAKLYDLELNKKFAEKQSLEDNKTDITWGSQIRSYVLDQSRIKDLRTGHESSNTQAVLDGDLDPFLESSLKHNISTNSTNI